MKKILSILLVLVLAFSLCTAALASGVEGAAASSQSADKAEIERALNIANNTELTWTYAAGADAWTMSVVTAVVNPILPNQQGVSVCVPGAYVTGIDTDGDGKADVTAETYSEPVNGTLVIDYEAEITSTNGQVYTAATAPVILNTGAAGYGSQSNRTAGTTYAREGYINVACGNRGKQDSIKDDDGSVISYVGDAPSCLVDQKNAARFVKFNILLGNLPGSVDYFVSTGGSGGAAHAAMFAATSNNPDFYDYEIEAGAVGVYRNADGTYSTTVTVDGREVEISDGAWGCVAYSAITSLYEADMAMAFEYYLDSDFSFNTDFQKQLAAYLSEMYMEYINAQGLTAEEAAVGFDLNGDGDLADIVAVTIEYDPDLYPETNGYHGTYCDLYLAEFTENVQWYVDNLAYASGWTWFDEDGTALTDAEVAAMTDADRAEAFIRGSYSNGSSGASSGPSGEATGNASGNTVTVGGVTEMIVGTPEEGTTQAAGSGTNSNNYETFEEMLAAYEADVAEVYAGDQYGKNIVELYDPARYIGAAGTDDPTWTRIVMGEKEGDMAMPTSLNLQLKWLAAGTDAVIEWQYNGGHVPSEIFGNSFALYVDEMYAKHVDGARPVEKAAAEAQTQNGDAEEANGTDISGWVTYEDGVVSITLKDAAAYRTAGQMKATPGFDVIDYGQEDYVFGSAERDARHWSVFVLEAMRENADALAALF